MNDKESHINRNGAEYNRENEKTATYCTQNMWVCILASAKWMEDKSFAWIVFDVLYFYSLPNCLLSISMHVAGAILFQHTRHGRCSLFYPKNWKCENDVQIWETPALAKHTQEAPNQRTRGIKRASHSEFNMKMREGTILLVFVLRLLAPPLPPLFGGYI